MKRLICILIAVLFLIPSLCIAGPPGAPRSGLDRWFKSLRLPSTAITDADTTPDATGRSTLITANTGATTITDFDGTLYDGQILSLIINDANTTLDLTSSGIEGNGSDYTCTNGELVQLIYSTVDSQWHMVIGVGGGTNATTVTLTDNESTNEENPIWFSAGAAGSGSVGPEADGDLTYNPSTGTLSVPSVSVSDSALAVGWNASTLVPTRNAIHDWAILFDTDLDGSLVDENFTWTGTHDFTGATVTWAAFDDVTMTDTKAIKNETDDADDYFALQATDEVGGTPAQVDMVRIYNAVVGGETTVRFGDGGTNYVQVDQSGDLTFAGTADIDLPANSVDSADIGTVVDSIVWNAGGFVPDGTQCAAASSVQINSGPYQYTVLCADNDGSSLYGHVVMPDSWDAGNVTFELSYIQTAADTSALNGDITIQCRGTGEAVNNTWESEVAMDDAAVTGSNAVDHLTSGNVSGTCVAGDTLYWRWQMDATGTTTAVGSLHFTGMKMEYTSNVGD